MDRSAHMEARATHTCMDTSIGAKIGKKKPRTFFSPGLSIINLSLSDKADGVLHDRESSRFCSYNQNYGEYAPVSFFFS